jgi:hypothetical protein
MVVHDGIAVRRGSWFIVGQSRDSGKASSTVGLRLTTKFSGRSPAAQHAGAPRPVVAQRRSPAAVHFMPARSAATQS